MSTRSTRFVLGPIHVYFDVVNRGYWVALGRDVYPRIVIPLTPWRAVRWTKS